MGIVFYGYVCLTRCQQYISYIVVISFIDGGNQSTWRKPSTCSKAL